MNRRITLSELSGVLARRLNIDKQTAGELLRNFFETIAKGLEEDQLVKVKGFATFKTLVVEERESVNVNTGERISIGSHTKISFTPDATLKALVNRPFAQFKTITLNEETDLEEFKAVDERMKPEPAKTEETQEETVVAMPEPAAEYSEKETEAARTLAAPATKEDTPTDTTPAPAEDVPAAKEPAADGAAAPSSAETEDAGPAEEKESPAKEVVSSKTAVPQETTAEAAEDAETAEATEQPDTSGVEAENMTNEAEETNKEQTDDSTPHKHASKALRIIGAIVCGVILFAAGICVGIHIPQGGSASPDKTPQQPVPPNAVQAQKADTSAKMDTINTTITQAPVGPAPATDIKKTADTVKKESPASAKKEETIQRLPLHPANNVEIVGTQGYHTLKNGEDLTHLALYYYGSKDYVRYIILHNDLKNPNIVHTGTRLKMPRLQLKK